VNKFVSEKSPQELNYLYFCKSLLSSSLYLNLTKPVLNFVNDIFNYNQSILKQNSKLKKQLIPMKESEGNLPINSILKISNDLQSILESLRDILRVGVSDWNTFLKS
jgi:hypothetical protein